MLDQFLGIGSQLQSQKFDLPDVTYVSDQRIVRRTPFCFKDLSNCRFIEYRRTKSIDRLGREGDDSAADDETGSLGRIGGPKC